MAEGGEGVEKGGTMSAEFQQYMANKFKTGPIQGIEGVITGMWAEDKQGTMTTEQMKAEMEGYAGRTLALKEQAQAESQATQATWKFTEAIDWFMNKEKAATEGNINNGNALSAGAAQTSSNVGAATSSMAAAAQTNMGQAATNFNNGLTSILGGTNTFVQQWGSLWQKVFGPLFDLFNKSPTSSFPESTWGFTAHGGPSYAQGLYASKMAVSQVGKPYIYGSDDPANGGFDCSGLVHWAYGKAGYDVPRETYGMTDMAYAVMYGDKPDVWKKLSMVPGAILMKGPHLSGMGGHMAMAIGGGSMVESGGIAHDTHTLTYIDPGRFPWIGWPMKSGGQSMADNVPALLHKKEVVVNAPIVDKIERMADRSVNYVDNSVMNINGSGLDKTQLREVLEDYDRTKATRFNNELKRYNR
jgi:cell wall-associated NlpC family hydrolase